MKISRAIVTGATGALGTALINELVSRNVEVLVLCHNGSKRIGNIPTHKLVRIRLCGLDELSRLENCDESAYDIFFHLAWQGTTGSDRDNMYMQNRNVQYALDAVGAAKRFGCKKFVGAGSQAEYGIVEGIITPDTPTFPETGYGIGKLSAGYMTHKYSHQLDLQFNWIRVLSIYGPNDWADSITMSTIRKIKQGEIPKFTKGEQLWDFLYSDDAARAFYLVGEKGIDGKTYVLGSGNVRPLSEYIYELRDTVKPGAEILLGAIPYSPHSTMRLQADISELKADTGWTAEVDYATGIRKICECLDDNKHNK